MATSEAQIDELIDDLVTSYPPDKTEPVKFLGEQFDRGLAWVHFPGRRRRSRGHARRPALRACARSRSPARPSAIGRNVIGYGMVAPTVVTHGTKEQKGRFLRPLFTGEEIWCQLFSEPGAGSDVAGLACRAEKDGDEWILNGQKVWTTLAHESAYGLLLARTNPDVPKHRGITAFLVDMRAPGVDVRPLFQATGEAEFNECFFVDARVPGRPAPRWRG